MNNTDLISVIIPVYNVEQYLNRCVDSVINQTYKNLEIILIDDGSTDNSGKICDEYSQKDKRVKVIHQKNMGVSNSRNKGINIAKGKYITFVDSDDVLNCQYIEFIRFFLILYRFRQPFLYHHMDICAAKTKRCNTGKPWQAILR